MMEINDPNGMKARLAQVLTGISNSIVPPSVRRDYEAIKANPQAWAQNIQPPSAEDLSSIIGNVTAAMPMEPASQIVRYYSGPTKTGSRWHVSPIMLDEAGNEIAGKPIDLFVSKRAAKAYAQKLNQGLKKP